MSSLQVTPPKYDPGTVLWLPGNEGRPPAKIMVVGVLFLMTIHGVHPYRYKVNNIYHSVEGLTTEVEEADLYATEQEAKDASKFIPIVLSENQWRSLIGGDLLGIELLSEDDTSFIGSELGVCCTDVETLRKVLTKARICNGITLHDLKKITTILDEHEWDSPTPILDQLKTQLTTS